MSFMHIESAEKASHLGPSHVNAWLRATHGRGRFLSLNVVTIDAHLYHRIHGKRDSTATVVQHL